MNELDKAVNAALVLQQTLGALDRKEIAERQHKALLASEEFLCDYFVRATVRLKQGDMQTADVKPEEAQSAPTRNRTMHDRR